MIEIKNNRYVRVRIVAHQDMVRLTNIMQAFGLPADNIIDNVYTPLSQDYSEDGLCILGTELTRNQIINFFDFMENLVPDGYSQLSLTYANGYTINTTKNIAQINTKNYSTALLVSVVFDSGHNPN